MEFPFEEEGVEEGADYSPAECTPLFLTVPDSVLGGRLDVVLASLLPQYSRSRLQLWIRDGQVTVDDKLVQEPKTKLMGGETLLVSTIASPEENAFSAEAVPLDVVYEDDAIAVINKPAGLVVHPATGNWSGTLLNGLLHRYPDAAQLPRAGIVHRLDKDTTGLMVVARSLIAQTDLVRQLQARTVKRQYVAVVVGRPLSAQGIVDAPIGRHPTQRVRMAVVKGGKPAITRYRVIKRFVETSYVGCQLETGRTHQIRVHMASIGHPLVGDELYRGRIPGPAFPRQALHARRLGLIHPITREPMEWHAAIPEDMEVLIARLREEAKVQAAIDREAAALLAAEAGDDEDFDDDDDWEGEVIYARGEDDN
jgi:23S rRNA pseudouridine1911/1915/1917 synthase